MAEHISYVFSQTTACPLWSLFICKVNYLLSKSFHIILALISLFLFFFKGKDIICLNTVTLVPPFHARSVVDDKKRRLRAFLSCMRSDTPLMLHTSHVPQHLLIMATVLRWVYFITILHCNHYINFIIITSYLQHFMINHLNCETLEMCYLD